MVLFMDAQGITPILAIDGGGTRCRLASFYDGSTVTQETGPANVSTDFDGALGEILEGVQRLSARLDVTPESLFGRPTFVGLAGVTGPAIANRLREALPFTTVRIEDDRPAALRGALGNQDGVLGHCGTGSFFGIRTSGVDRFVGGWGRILGDEASAFWVGRAALQKTLIAADGLLEQSDLTHGILEEFGGTAGIVHLAATAEPADVAKIAKRVTTGAASDDAIATDIMRTGANEIAETLTKLGWVKGLPICLTGGIGPHFARHLPDDMRSSLIEPIGTPLDGALALARELAFEAVP